MCKKTLNLEGGSTFVGEKMVNSQNQNTSEVDGNMVNSENDESTSSGNGMTGSGNGNNSDVNDISKHIEEVNDKTPKNGNMIEKPINMEGGSTYVGGNMVNSQNRKEIKVNGDMVNSGNDQSTSSGGDMSGSSNGDKSNVVEMSIHIEEVKKAKREGLISGFIIGVLSSLVAAGIIALVTSIFD